MIIKDFPLPFWFEFMSLLISIILIRRLINASMGYLILILTVNVTVECIGMYLKYFEHKQTAWLYNILTIIQIPLWVVLFKKQTDNFFLRKKWMFIVFVFLAFAFTNLFILQGPKQFNNYTLILGAGIIICLSCVFLFQLIKNNHSHHPVTIPMFWITSGSFFYFSGTFLYFSFYDYLLQYYKRTGNEIFSYINLNLIIVFYTCISIGMLRYLNRN